MSGAILDGRPGRRDRPHEWIKGPIIQLGPYRTHTEYHPDDADHISALIPTLTDIYKGRVPEFRRSRHAVVYRVERPDSDEAYFIKRFLIRDLWDFWKGLTRTSRARHSAVIDASLPPNGFHSPQPVCVCICRRMGILTESILITREVPRLREVRSQLSQLEQPHVTRNKARNRLLKALANEVARWHTAGFAHGDLRLTNIMLHGEGDATNAPVFYWMDNERTIRYRKLPESQRIRNLSQIIKDPNLLLPHEVAFLWREYKRACGLSPTQSRSIARKTITALQRAWRQRGYL